MRFVYNAAFIFIVISPFSSYSQSNFTERYFDYNWQNSRPDNARFYSITKKNDSGWIRMDFFLLDKKNKLQMKGLYADKENTIRNGIFNWYYAYSGLKTHGEYINNKKEGTWYDFFENGEMEDSLNYKNDLPIGISLSRYQNGYQKDSLNMDENGNGTYVKWFDNGAPSEAGRYIDFDKKIGKWQYFNKNGNLSEDEVYDNGVLQSRNDYNQDGTINSDTASRDHEAFFPGGDKAWKKYLNANLRFPNNLELRNSNSVTVVVLATIDEDGNIIDVEIPVPFQKDFDNITMDVFKNSPKWIPAVEHNRKVYSTARLAVEYNQNYY